MHILLTNDDGVHAEGLATLAAAAVRHAGPNGSVTVVAPDREHSGCGHRVTVADTLTLIREEDGPSGPGGVRVRRFSLDGTPADCVRIGLHHFADLREPGERGGPFDWVLSGVNHGGNLGVDVFLSGTAAAAREATLAGVASAALSRFRRGSDAPWEDSVELLDRVLTEILAEPPGPGAYWNANLPHPPDVPTGTTPAVVHCHPEAGPLPVSFKAVEGEGSAAVPEGSVVARYRYGGSYPDRSASEGSDVSVCFGGAAALCRLPLFP
ncbi:5'/3'-nucleotidase SurE [Alienimonas californiensis]|uniref:5'-nucleotidase n=1 Tax=Alienimonas californiensis TaxID=2527989 RepID=A0A517PAG1_9PLAN|nr:5'/3'-nucleotidase SurE [Alienimonas californiensis]QDT16355.1 5'-nucleotidase SurE [Alienimonas californiensis]